MPALVNYLSYLLIASLLLAVFFVIYTKTTPWNELLLIRQGNNAAMLSLAGALLGFSLTVASCILHTTHWIDLLIWAVAAMLVQLAAYAATSRLLRISKEHIESGNSAFGGLLGAISLSIGAINAACIS